MANLAFAKRVSSLQNGIVRELHNAHIFLRQARPLLVKAKSKYDEGEPKADPDWYLVSSGGRKTFTERTAADLKAIYDHYISVGLFEAFLVNSLSRFESFLAAVLYEFFVHYPLRLTEKFQGVPACPDVSPKELVEAPDKDQLVQRLMREHLANVFRQRPSIYMPYVAKLLNAKDAASFLDYYEIAATRDLVVHNSRVVNQLYLEKAGSKARGGLGETLPVDQAYYYDALTKMTDVSRAIRRDVESKFGAAKAEI